MLALAVAGCGGSPAGGDAAPARVDVPGQVLALSVGPGGELWLSTDKGVFAVDGSRARAVRGELEGVPVGRNLIVASTGADRLLGSGHPDSKDARPYDLGLLRSQDGGRTWAPVSLASRSDLHLLRVRGEILYAYDLARDRFLASRDLGRSWREHPPRGLMLDLAVHPRDPDRLVASTSEGLVASDDGGDTWRALARDVGLLLAWPEPDALYTVDERGTVERSADGGGHRDVVGTLGTAPEALTAASDGTLYAAGRDDTVAVSRDGGRTWRVKLRLG